MAYRLINNLYLQVEPLVENTSLGESKVVKKLSGVVAFDNFMGFVQDVEVQTGDTRDYVLSQNLKKDTISIELFFNTYHMTDGTEISAYSSYNQFRKWIAQYSDLTKFRTTLIMGYGTNSETDYPYQPPTDGTESNLFGRRIDGFFKTFGSDIKLSNGGSLTISTTFQALSRPYTATYKQTTVSASSGTIIYKYTYPYTYGYSSMSNNIIENKFFKDIPIKITIHGPESADSSAVTNPIISLHYGTSDSTGNLIVGDQYSEVSFSNISIAKGEKLVVDANQFTIYQESTGGKRVNKYTYTDKSNDSFLFAKPGTTLIYLTSGSLSTDWKMDVEYTEYDF
jgi:hypothetical protein